MTERRKGVVQEGGRTVIYFSRWKLVTAGLAWSMLAALGALMMAGVFTNAAQAGTNADAKAALEGLLITIGAVGFGVFNLAKVWATLRKIEEPALVLDEMGFSAATYRIRYAEWSELENVRYVSAGGTLGSPATPGLHGLRLRFHHVPVDAVGFLSDEVRIPTRPLSVSGEVLYYLFEGHLRAFRASRPYR